MIIDSHVHYGNSIWGNFSPEMLIAILGEDIDYAICSNLEGIDSSNISTELDCNIDMLRVAKKYPKLKPLAVCQPSRTQDNLIIKYLLTEFPQFIGLKFHPECMKLPATSEEYDKYLDLARDFKKPCLFHSGHIKSRFSSPALIYEKAKQYPDVPFILGHLSTGPRDSHEEAINILLDSIENNTALLYTDVSWIDLGTGNFEDVILLIKKLKNSKKGDMTERILWASDTPIGEFHRTNSDYLHHLELFKKAITDEFKDNILLENLLWKNTRNLYNI